MTLKWYMEKNDNDIVLSTRVRLARNLKDYPFSTKLTIEQRSQMLKEVKSNIERYGTCRYNYIDISAKSAIEKNFLVEEHIISREFASMPPSEHRMLIFDENGNTSIMVGEEDHLRIQTIRAGFCLEDTLRVAMETDEILSKGLEFAFSEELGYLTCCPSNTGTGMRASVMLHLPLLSRNNYMKAIIELCSRRGLTVRGFYGEGSGADGEIYQISNQMTLGISEEESIKNLSETVNAIVEKEKELRGKFKDLSAFEIDKLWRSYGILSYTRCISTEEFLRLWSDVALARECGLIEELKEKNLIKLLIECMPAHIISAGENASTPDLRDMRRAEKIREFLKI